MRAVLVGQIWGTCANCDVRSAQLWNVIDETLTRNRENFVGERKRALASVNPVQLS